MSVKSSSATMWARLYHNYFSLAGGVPEVNSCRITDTPVGHTKSEKLFSDTPQGRMKTVAGGGGGVSEYVTPEQGIRIIFFRHGIFRKQW